VKVSASPASVQGTANSADSFGALLSTLEGERKSRIFSIVHMGKAHVCWADYPKFVMDRKNFQPVDTLEIVLHTPGGEADFAYKLVKFFRRRCKQLNVIVPLMAKSAGTLMCLGADTIFMGEFGELGPVDVQITDPVERGMEPMSPLDELKSMEFLRDYAVELFDFFTALIIRNSGMSVKDAIRESSPYVSAMVRPLYEKIDPLEVGEHRRALAIGEDYAKRLLKLTDNPVAPTIVDKLVRQYSSHDFGIDFDEAAELKLPVRALDRSQDERLTAAIMELHDDGLSFTGFAPKQPAAVSANQQAAQTRRRKLRTSPNGLGAGAG
jgi:Serine dehydrogenase proteinase